MTTITSYAATAREYAHLGYTLIKGLISTSECERIAEHFDQIHADPPHPSYSHKTAQETDDPLEVYPRVMHPHRWDPLSLQYLLDERITNCLRALIGEEPLAAQTMFYYKPPGSRGQALHQDNFYLRVEPCTCVAAWLAIDGCDQDNGGMRLVPHTGDLEIACPKQADMTESFGTHYVPPPAGLEPQLIPMAPGDVLFFNGSVIHGSLPNRSNRFRRSFISHYIGASAPQVAHFYKPLLNARGQVVDRPDAVGGGACGENYPYRSKAAANEAQPIA